MYCMGSDKNVTPLCIFHSIVFHISRSEQWWPTHTARSPRRAGESHTPPHKRMSSWLGSWSRAECRREAAGGGEAAALFLLVQGATRGPATSGSPPGIAVGTLDVPASLGPAPILLIQDRSGRFPLVEIHWSLFKENSLVFSPRKVAVGFKCVPLIGC